MAWDRYAYAYNNPVLFIDPTGHSACIIGKDAKEITVADCEGWVNSALRKLSLTETGKEIVDKFRVVDERDEITIVVGGTIFGQNINNILKSEGDFIFNTIYLQPKTILAGSPSEPAAWKEGGLITFAHEATHANQGFWKAFSLEGEIGASLVEFDLTKEMNDLINVYNNAQDPDGPDIKEVEMNRLARAASELGDNPYTFENLKKFKPEFGPHPFWRPITGSEYYGYLLP